MMGKQGGGGFSSGKGNAGVSAGAKKKMKMVIKPFKVCS